MKPNERENIKYREGKKNFIKDPEREAIKLLPEKYSIMLDIGCGEGGISSQFVRRGKKVVGLDFSEVAVKLAKAKGIDAKVHDVDIGLPFEESSFDVILCGDLIEHIFDPIFLFNEMSRVLKNSGVVILTVPNDMYFPNRLTFLFGLSPHLNTYKRLRQVKHHSVMSYELIEYFAKEAGFEFKNFISFCRLPKIGTQFKSSNKYIAKMLGYEYVIKLTKTKLG